MKEHHKYIKNYYYDEIFGEKFYKELAKRVKSKHIKDKLLEMAKTEKRHAEFWKALGNKKGIQLKEKNFRWRLFFLLFLSHISWNLTTKIIEYMESQAIRGYAHLIESDFFSSQEKRKIKEIMKDEILHESPFKETSESVEHIRDMFLGINDALVEILATLAGISTIYSSSLIIGILGSVVGISGMLSMSIGTYISVKNQREVKEYEHIKNNLLDNFPYGIYENPLKAAYTTGLFYLIGTIIVVLPFFIINIPIKSLILSVIFASLTWIISGIIIALSSGISIKRKVLEMLLTGWGASIITYTLGNIISKFVGV